MSWEIGGEVRTIDVDDVELVEKTGKVTGSGRWREGRSMAELSKYRVIDSHRL